MKKLLCSLSLALGAAFHLQAQTLLEEVQPDDFNYNFLVTPVFTSDRSGSGDYYCYVANNEKLVAYHLKGSVMKAMADSDKDSHKKNIAQYGLATNGRELATVGEDNSIKVWSSTLTNLCTIQERATQYSYQSGMGAVGIDKKSALVAYAMYSENQQEGTLVKLYDYILKKEIAVLRGHGRELLTTIVFSPDGKYIASSSNKEAIVWETATGNKVVKETGGTICTFSPDGASYLLRIDAGLAQKNLKTGSRVSFEGASVSKLAHFAYNPSDNTLWVAEGASFQQWNATTGKLLNETRHYGMSPTFSMTIPQEKRALGISSSKMHLIKLDW